jgi:hypothetical protein
MIELKEARLAGERPSCRLDRIKLDLTDRSARRRLLADVSALPRSWSSPRAWFRI